MPIQVKQRFRPSLPFVALCVFLALLWVVGGASRADASGQILVQGGAALVLVVAILFGPRPDIASARPIWLLLLAAILLMVVQLIPLPPGVWPELPGRAMFAEADFGGQSQSWRPWSLTPGATTIALTGMLTPLAVLLLMTSISAEERLLTVNVVFLLTILSALLGLMQFSGGGLNNPFINDTLGAVSGSFANRNHLALFLAIGCLLTMFWAFSPKHSKWWRGLVAAGLLLLILLLILATGSRAGMGLGGLAVSLGAIMFRKKIQRDLRGLPRWVQPAILSAILIVFAGFIYLSIAANRAVSLQRIFYINSESDMRANGLPIVLDIIQNYFPFGTGFGSFDPIFRIYEPLRLLKITYFNHAHNDFLEILIEAGLPGALLMLAALGWWAVASTKAWRLAASSAGIPAKLGSSIILLIIIASIFDYPARTPMIAAIIVIAATWLSDKRATAN